MLLTTEDSFLTKYSQISETTKTFLWGIHACVSITFKEHDVATRQNIIMMRPFA